MSFECVLLREPQTGKSFNVDEENIAEPQTGKSSNMNEENIAGKIPENYTGSMLPKRKKQYRCCVTGCSSKHTAKDISFHRLPKAKMQLKLWKIKCRLADKIPLTYTVCSRHFLASDYSGYLYNAQTRKLLKSAVPSQNLPVASYARKRNSAQIESRAQRLLNRNSKQSPNSLKVDVPGEELSTCAAKLYPSKVKKYPKPTITSVLRKQPTISMKQPQNTIAQVNLIKTKNATSTIERTSSPRVNAIDILNLKSRTKLHAWTGIQTFSLLHKIEERVSSTHPKVLDGSDLSLLECILLCFIKLNTKLSFVCLTSIFHLSSASAARIYQSLLPHIQKALQDVDYFSSTFASKDTEPITLRMYGYDEARAIVDGTEAEKVSNIKCDSKIKIEPLSTDPLD